MDIIIGNNSVILRNMLGEILTDVGNKIVSLTANGQEIIELTKTRNVDLIILGENLSIATEQEVIQEVRNSHPIPIVLMASGAFIGSVKPHKILEKPNMDKMSQASYHKELILELNKVVDGFKRTNKTRIINMESIIEHIVIGSSTGGPNALKELLDRLPADFPIPISIVQHMEVGHEEGLATWLNKTCKLDVRMAMDKDRPKPGEVLMAEQGKHLSMKNKVFFYTDEDKVQFQKPAVDVLFSTAAKCYRQNLLGILLTGMGRDGAKGCLEIINNGGRTVVQDEETSTVYGMPRAAVELNAASQILPIDEITNYIISAIKREE